eukprot:COSAG04_NODE_542_length_12865_cov_44.119693_16_plen_216_part_00
MHARGVCVGRGRGRGGERIDREIQKGRGAPTNGNACGVAPRPLSTPTQKRQNPAGRLRQNLQGLPECAATAHGPAPLRQPEHRHRLRPRSDRPQHQATPPVRVSRATGQWGHTPHHRTLWLVYVSQVDDAGAGGSCVRCLRSRQQLEAKLRLCLVPQKVPDKEQLHENIIFFSSLFCGDSFTAFSSNFFRQTKSQVLHAPPSATRPNAERRGAHG